MKSLGQRVEKVTGLDMDGDGKVKWAASNVSHSVRSLQIDLNHADRGHVGGTAASRAAEAFEGEGGEGSETSACAGSEA